MIMKSAVSLVIYYYTVSVSVLLIICLVSAVLEGHTCLPDVTAAQQWMQ